MNDHVTTMRGGTSAIGNMTAAITGGYSGGGAPSGISLFAGKAGAVPSLQEGFTLNQPNMLFRDGKVQIKAYLDLNGLAEMETTIANLRVLLKSKTADDIAYDQARMESRPDPLAWR